MGEWRYRSAILDLGSRWRRVVTFTPLPFYPQGKSPWYPLDGRLGGPQSRSGRCGEEKNLSPAGNRTLAIHSVAIPTELCRALKHVTLATGTARGCLTVNSGCRRRKPSVPLSAVNGCVVFFFSFFQSKFLNKYSAAK
jgi:hypothetical protein